MPKMLPGICANLSKTVCNSTMGHLVVRHDDSRFQYSHGFTNLLVSQAIDVMDGKDGQFCIRTNFSRVQKANMLWPDSAVDDYIHRPDEFEAMCSYNYVGKCGNVSKTFKQMNKNQSVEGQVELRENK